MRRYWVVVAVSACLAVCAAPFAEAGLITTTFLSDNEFQGNMFDVTALDNALRVTALDINASGSDEVTVYVYLTPGTYVGSETNSAAWTLVSQTVVTAQGMDNATPVDVTDFILPANLVTGMYVTLDVDEWLNYTNGTDTVSNAEIQLDLGVGLGGFFGQSPPGDADVISDRIWNGTIHYIIPEPAALSLLGLGGLALLGRLRRKSG